MRITLVKYYDVDQTTGAVNRLIEGYCDSAEWISLGVCR